MAGIGNSAYILSVQQEKLTQGLNEATGQIQGFVGKTQGLLGGLGSSLGSVFSFGAVGAAIGAVVGAVTSGFSQIQQIGKDLKLADALNIPPQAFEGISLILQKAGKDASETGSFFAELGTKIEKAASTGRGPLARTLQELGVDMQALKAQSIDEQFFTLADAIQKVGPGAQAAALAMHAFGDAALLPQLLQGRAGLQSFLSEARASGRLASDEQLRAAQEAAKAWEGAQKTLSAAWKSVSTEVAVALTPVIKIAADIFKNVVGVVSPVVKGIGEAFTAVMDVLGPVFTTIIDWVKGVVGAIGEWLAHTGIVLPSIRDIILTTFHAVGVAGAYVFDTIKAAVGGLSISFSPLVEAVGNTIDAFNEMAGNAKTHFGDIGASMRTWGAGAVLTFGQSRRVVDDFFANLKKKKDEANAAPLRPPAAPRPDQAPEYHASAALLEGSKEAYSLEVQSKLASQLGVAPTDLQERIADAAEETVASLGRIEDKLGDRGEQIELRTV